MKYPSQISDDEKAFLFPKEYWNEGEAPANAVSLADMLNEDELNNQDRKFLENLHNLSLIDKDIVKKMIEIRWAINNRTPLTQDQADIINILQAKELSGADLRGLNLKCFNFDNANLSKAKLKTADLSYASCKYANFTWANLEGTRNERTFYLGENLTSAVFSNSKNEEANFFGARIEDAIFSRAECPRAVFNETDCSGSLLWYANFSHVDFSRAKFQDTQFGGAILIGASFGQAKFYNVDDMSEAVYDESTNFSDATFYNSPFIPLTGATFVDKKYGQIHKSKVVEQPFPEQQNTQPQKASLWTRLKRAFTGTTS